MSREMTEAKPQDAGEVWAASWAQTVGRRVKSERVRLGLTAAQLSERTAQVGYPIDRSAIARMESQPRPAIYVHHLLVLAAALGISPLSLLFDPTRAWTESTPGVTKSTIEALMSWWAINRDVSFKALVEEYDLLAQFQMSVSDAFRARRTYDEFASDDTEVNERREIEERVAAILNAQEWGRGVETEADHAVYELESVAYEMLRESEIGVAVSQAAYRIFRTRERMIREAPARTLLRLEARDVSTLRMVLSQRELGTYPQMPPDSSEKVDFVLTYGRQLGWEADTDSAPDNRDDPWGSQPAG